MALYKNRLDDGVWDYFKDLFFFYQSFDVFIKQINLFIEDEVANEKAIYENYLNESGDEDLFDHFNHQSDWKATEGLVDIYYDSFIMSLYAFTEKKMFILSKYLSRHHPIKLEDISGKGIFKYRKYLSKVCNIDFSSIEKDWEVLLHYNLLRNHLVHAEGERSLPKDHHRLIGFLESIHGVVMKSDQEKINFHFTSDSILYDLLNCSRRIIEYLYKEKA